MDSSGARLLLCVENILLHTFSLFCRIGYAMGGIVLLHVGVWTMVRSRELDFSYCSVNDKVS